MTFWLKFWCERRKCYRKGNWKSIFTSTLQMMRFWQCRKQKWQWATITRQKQGIRQNMGKVQRMGIINIWSPAKFVSLFKKLFFYCSLILTEYLKRKIWKKNTLHKSFKLISMVFIWLPSKTRLNNWWRNICWQAQLNTYINVHHQVCTHLRRDVGQLLLIEIHQIL